MRRGSADGHGQGSPAEAGPSITRTFPISARACKFLARCEDGPWVSGLSVDASNIDRLSSLWGRSGDGAASAFLVWHYRLSGAGCATRQRSGKIVDSLGRFRGARFSGHRGPSRPARLDPRPGGSAPSCPRCRLLPRRSTGSIGPASQTEVCNAPDRT